MAGRIVIMTISKTINLSFASQSGGLRLADSAWRLSVVCVGVNVVGTFDTSCPLGAWEEQLPSHKGHGEKVKTVSC